MMRTAERERGRKLARGLAIFSIGLGVAELLAPRQLARIAGVRRPNTKLVRLFGVREVASGVGILMKPSSAGAVWSRVAGDALDLATLGLAFGLRRSKKSRLALATANVSAVTALDVMCARRLSGGSGAWRSLQQSA